MPVRMIKKEERLECEKIQSVAFAFSLDTAKVEKEIAEKPDPVNPYIGFFNDQNVITACMELPEYRMRYEGNWVRMVGIGGVASLPEYRFGGAVREILQFAFRQMRENGTVFSSLYPFSHNYYRKFGYETCQLHTMGYELPVEALSKFRCTGTARMIQPGDSLKSFQAIFDAHFLRYNMPVQREERHWKRLLSDDPYKDRVYSYLLEDENGPSAYLVMGVQPDGEHNNICHVRETAFARPEGLTDVLGLLYRLSAQFGTVHIELPDDVPFAALIDETYEIKNRYSNQQMTRVIDVQKALELKRHPEGAAYTLCVRDDGIPENDGVFCVRNENGKVCAEKQTDTGSADLTVDVRTLGQLLLGFLSIDEAVYKSDVQVHANMETLKAVFIRRNVFLTEHF